MKQWPAASVEVKATRARGDGSAKHRISRLDQLEDAEKGELFLFSLRAIPDPIGGHSLDASVERIRGGLVESPESLHLFDERLRDVGYQIHPDRPEDLKLRVVAEELYRVDADFPRLTGRSFSEGVPNGVDGIAYTLDLVSCRDWRVATAPGPESRQLRATVA